MKKLVRFTLIVLLGTVGAILYGVIHDQITVRICPEYFTIWHPQITVSTNPQVVALLWGVVATWWMGVLLGLLLAMAALLGPWPAASLRSVLIAILSVAAMSAFCAFVAGLATWQLQLRSPLSVAGDLIYRLGDDTVRRFTIDLAVHNVSYSASAIFTLVAALVLFAKRKPRDSATRI